MIAEATSFVFVPKSFSFAGVANQIACQAIEGDEPRTNPLIGMEKVGHSESRKLSLLPLRSKLSQTVQRSAQGIDA